MTEQSPKQNYDYNERPLGRFLLSRSNELDRERIWHRGAYGYVRNFASEYRDQLQVKGASSIAAVEIDSEGNVTLPRTTPAYERGAWLEFEQEPGINRYTWRVNSDRVEYYMDFDERSCVVIRYEMNTQGSVLRRDVVTDQNAIEGIQSLVETIVTVADIDKKVIEHRESMAQNLEEYKILDTQSRLSPRQQKEKVALWKHASEPLFHTGSIGPRNKRPLY